MLAQSGDQIDRPAAQRPGRVEHRARSSPVVRRSRHRAVQLAPDERDTVGTQRAGRAARYAGSASSTAKRSRTRRCASRTTPSGSSRSCSTSTASRGSTSRARSRSSGTATAGRRRRSRPTSTCRRTTSTSRSRRSTRSSSRRRTARRAGCVEQHPDVSIRVLYQRDYLHLLVKYGLEPPSQLVDAGRRRRDAGAVRLSRRASGRRHARRRRRERVTRRAETA